MKLSTGLVLTRIPSLANITPEQTLHVQAWITALRSGEYLQTTGTLRYNERYCCLGVGCDVAAKAGAGIWTKLGDGHYSEFNVSGSCSEAVMPWRLGQDFYGLSLDSSSQGLIVETNEGANLDLTTLNDKYHATFNDIALMLETALAGGLNPD